jgi:cytochrome P450
VLDEALPKGEFDFVREVASEIPMQVFAEDPRIPQDERRVIIEIGDRLLGNQDPRVQGPRQRRAPPSSVLESRGALEMFEFGRRLAAERRRQPEDDIITQLAFEPLTQQEFDVYFVLLATAGNETTRHTITHGLLGLAEHPAELEKLRDAGTTRRCAVRAEEMLRWATPVHHFRPHRGGRLRARPGTEIKAGDKVTTWFVSGNRDESVFEHPDAFDVGRTPNPHMAVRAGRRATTAWARHLAKMEVRIAFEELLAARRHDRADRPGRSACARTSSTGSSACRCG